MNEAAQLRKFRVPLTLPVSNAKWSRVVNARWMDENTLQETAAIFKLVDDEGFTTPITYQVDRRSEPAFKSGFGIMNTDKVFESWQDLRAYWPEYIDILRAEGCEGIPQLTGETMKDKDFDYQESIQSKGVQQQIAFSALSVQAMCHGLAAQAGWWKNPKTGEDPRDNPLCFSNKLCLIHSEVSEAMEGDRKNLPDDHLPHRSMREVELADAVIRIFDLAGAYGLDVPGAIAEKLAYNAKRADHKLENRAKEGGKAY